ncbi:MAG TPA: glycoside hydrolase family 99-like domain-containing protein [Tepidisphaeraceae bacterium]|nr:glycoside hydrolase family 99-like domain-containing protein [Tepidisphaeraceae bacterium]
MKLFHDPQHVTVDGKPLIILFAHSDMRKQFGSSDAVKKAWDELRVKATASGLKGGSVAVVCAPGPENGWADLNKLAAEGYDLFTGYNYHAYPKKGGERIQSFATMIEGHEEIWKRFAAKNIKPYIPVVTAGWDPRAWQPPEQQNDPSNYWVYYPDRTATQVQDFTSRAANWIKANPNSTTKEKLLLLYAWNELGEGGYICPTKSLGDAYLKAIQSALK